MSGSNYSLTYSDGYAILSARIKKMVIPLVSSKDKLKVECVYHNILTGAYKSVRELCEDIYDNFKSQATLLVLTTLVSTARLSAKA